MTEVVVTRLDEAEARELTEAVKHDAAALWTKLVRLYEGGAHEALGYRSWGDYWVNEFGRGSTRGYRLLEAGEVVAAITESTGDLQTARDIRVAHGQLPRNERVARELAPLRHDPGVLRQAWSEAVDQHGPTPTAAQVRDVVEPKRDLVGEAIRRKQKTQPDGRFGNVKAVAMILRRDMPAPEDLWLPDDTGNQHAFAEALDFIADWLPRMEARWRQHTQTSREAA